MSEIILKYIVLPLIVVLFQYIILILYINYQFKKYGISLKDIPSLLKLYQQEKDDEELRRRPFAEPELKLMRKKKARDE